jgi:Flp pilus assembly protein TadD
VAAVVVGALVFLAAEATLAFPYLSAREMSTALDIQNRNSGAALQALTRAANLNPLSSEPGRLGGLIALRTGRFTEAQKRFQQAIAREPGAWLPWLGAGLAASALGNERQAHRDFVQAAKINIRQAAVAEALQRVNTRHPLTPPEALKLLIFVD